MDLHIMKSPLRRDGKNFLAERVLDIFKKRE